MFAAQFSPLGTDRNDVAPFQLLPKGFEPKLKTDQNTDFDPLKEKRRDSLFIAGCKVFMLRTEGKEFCLGLGMEDFVLVEGVCDVVE